MLGGNLTESKFFSITSHHTSSTCGTKTHCSEGRPLRRATLYTPGSSTNHMTIRTSHARGLPSSSARQKHITFARAVSNQARLLNYEGAMSQTSPFARQRSVTGAPSDSLAHTRNSLYWRSASLLVSSLQRNAAHSVFSHLVTGCRCLRQARKISSTLFAVRLLRNTRV